MKRLIVLIGLALSLIATPALADGNWTITNFHSDLTIQEDGILDVVETIDADFSSEPHHGIYRDVPFRYNVDGHDEYMNFTVVDVKRDGRAEQNDNTNNSANLRIKIGDPDLTITGEHTYIIHYTVVGALRGFADYDELNWDVTGHEWEVPIERASATLSLPKDGILQSACYTGPVGSTESNCNVNKNSGSSIEISSHQPVKQGDDFTIAVGFSKGLVPIAEGSAPYSALSDSKSYGLGFMLSVLALALFGLDWWKNGRDEEWKQGSNGHQAQPRPLFATHETVMPEYRPPNNLLPAELEIILTESSSAKAISATIVDLAVRGYLTIQETKGGWFRRREYTLTCTNMAEEGLAVYEQILIDTLFKKGSAVTLSQLAKDSDVAQGMLLVKQNLTADLTKRGIFVGNPEKRRSFWLTIGIIGLTALAIAWAWLDGTTLDLSRSWLALGTAIGLLSASLCSIIFGLLAPKRSAAGRHLYQQALGYKLFLSQTERYRQPFLEDQGLFMKVLPYAMVFGVTDKLLKAMQHIGVSIPQPSWYVGSSAWTSTAFASDVSNLTSAVSSMSSSSASSGGGSSGGGGGGGGGGGW